MLHILPLRSIAENRIASTAANCTGAFTSTGHNLLESGCESSLSASDLSAIDPQLKTLNLNDGETLTISLQADSPALNAGGSTITVDQRGFSRDDKADIGAYERIVISPLPIYLPLLVR